MRFTAIAKKILSIEDDPSFSRYLSYMLTKEGYEVLTATNGLTGLRKAQEENPDLILLDVMLPGLDGFEVCHRLRAEPKTANLPVLMLSAKGQDSDRVTGLRVGANEFLNKPIDREVLLSKIKEYLPETK
ncbi:MAG: response regulator [Dehalococcoidales bacterium]|nr:response regulator [Dehalococcoidales bacterium]